MFGIGILELAVVLIVALIVLGPRGLPEAARTLGRWFYQMKDTAESAKREIEKEWMGSDASPLHPPTGRENAGEGKHVP